MACSGAPLRTRVQPGRGRRLSHLELIDAHARVELEFNPSVGVDYLIWSLQLSGLGSLLAGINFLVTIIKKRAPDMTLMKMPLFTWNSLCAMVLIISAFPVLTAVTLLLWFDRAFG